MIPHPYPEGAATAWIAKQDDDSQNDRIHYFTVEATANSSARSR
ncbi:MAG TPA: hypothetical protein VEK79_15645 [Thermoanaerobaculia bacterium]|nr:hypothetical protein [Thermoanaerobaculia bacterium]